MTLPVATFEKFIVRHRLTGIVQAETALRVGAGSSFDAANTDQPLIRDALGRPFIPGSSLKGALRSALEAVIRGLPADCGLRACDLFSDFDQDDLDLQKKGTQGKEAEKIRVCGDVIKRPKNTEGKIDPVAEVDAILAASCTVCGLFGSPLIAGRIFFHDLPAVDDLLPTEVRDGVGIDRDLGTARPKIKYDVEVVPKGSQFQLDITMENLADHQLALALQAIRWLKEGGVPIGGMTTRGLGRISVHDLRLHKIEPKDLLLNRKPREINWSDAIERSDKELEALILAEEVV